MSCGARFYDLNKKPIICPSCSTEFTGEVKVKARRGRLPAEAADAPMDDEEDVATVENENEDSDEVEGDEETVSLEEISEDDSDEDDADLLVEDDDLEMDDDDLDDIDDDDIDEDIAEEDEDK